VLVEAYWQIGKRIVEQEQQGDDTAEYGARLLERLSEDLQHKPGRGFSISNLRNMRRFYLDNRIHQAPGELNWTQHVELLPVTNKAGAHLGPALEIVVSMEYGRREKSTMHKRSMK